MSGVFVHSLGMAAGAMAAVLWITDAWRTAGGHRLVRRRLVAVLGAAAPVPERARIARDLVRMWSPVAGAACAALVLVGGSAGLLAASAAGYAAHRWLGHRTRREEYDADHATRELPLAADLLAACVAAGAEPVAAARAVGESLAGPVGERLASGAAEIRLGAAPDRAWRRLGALPGAAPLARLLERAEESGAPAAAPVARLAERARAESGRAATARARRAGVLMTAPVGLCFLPAFITVGVLPVVIGLAGRLLRG